MNQSTQPLSTAQRMAFHRIFSTWLAQASLEEYQLLEQAREQFAPKEVCSAIRLFQGCQAHPDLRQRLPATLVQLLQARNWPQGDFAPATAEIPA